LCKIFFIKHSFIIQFLKNKNKMKKKNVIIVIVVAVLFVLSFLWLSKSEENPAKMVQAKFTAINENKSAAAQTAYAVSRSILEGDWEKLDGLLDKDFTYTGDGSVYTKDEYIGYMQSMRAAFSNFDMILDNTVVDSNFVAVRFTAKVINTGSFVGAPANQKNLIVNGSFQRRVSNGKVMQEWQSTDILGVMTQIGFGATFGYSVFVTGFGVKSEAPVRKPNDFLHVNGKVANFDVLSAKEKNKYLDEYLDKFNATLKK
jgi:predicted ester cyclase